MSSGGGAMAVPGRWLCAHLAAELEREAVTTRRILERVRLTGRF
jgi:hypothetical protein